MTRHNWVRPDIYIHTLFTKRCCFVLGVEIPTFPSSSSSPVLMLESVSVCLSKWELRGMKTPRADGEAEEEDAVVSERSEGNGKGER